MAPAVKHFSSYLDTNELSFGTKITPKKEGVRVYQHLCDTVVIVGQYGVVLSDRPFPCFTSDRHFESVVSGLSDELREKCRDLYYNELKNPDNFIGSKFVAEIWKIPKSFRARKITTNTETKHICLGYEVIKERHPALR